MLTHIAPLTGVGHYVWLNAIDTCHLHDAPRRKSLARPWPSATFVRPLRQSLIEDPRLAPGTTRMLCLLAGWGGRSTTINTTLGSIGRKLKRSARQVQRYLKDAADEGYLTCTRRVDRLGYVIGLRIVLFSPLIFAPKRRLPAPKPKHRAEPPKVPGSPATTYMSDTNENKYILDGKDAEYDQRLRVVLERHGIPYQNSA